MYRTDIHKRLVVSGLCPYGPQSPVYHVSVTDAGCPSLAFARCTGLDARVSKASQS